MHEPSPQQQQSPHQPHALVVRSLRRRLWHALQQGDVATSIRAYQANHDDYELWLAEEAEEAASKEEARLRSRKEKLESRPKVFQKFGSMVKSHSVKFQNNKRRNHPKQLRSEKSDSCLQQEQHLCSNSASILQTELQPSEPFEPDDFRCPHGSYEEISTLAENSDAQQQPRSTSRKSKTASRRRVARLAGFWGKPVKTPAVLEEAEDGEQEAAAFMDERMTTPLHEAARIGSGQLIRLMLQNGGNPNVKNGKLRTALHMVAGGIHHEEDQGEDVGLHAIPMTVEQDETPAKASSETVVRAVGRFLKHSLRKGNKKAAQPETEVTHSAPIPDPERCNELQIDRMDTVLAVLSWYQPNEAGGEGPSINAVDAAGRTALHYAAELGREDICMAILSSFGAILTVIDDSSRTPCELAAAQNHHSLAARLEARALLYSDPYGIEDELMAAALAEQDGTTRSTLTPPFSWYETWSWEKVGLERRERISSTFEKMMKVVSDRIADIKAKCLMYGYADFEEPCNSTGEAKPGEENATKEDEQPQESDRVDAILVEPLKTEHETCHGVETDGIYCFRWLQESHVERYLAFHNWDPTQAVAAFKEDHAKAFVDATVPFPRGPRKDQEARSVMTCLICCDEFDCASDQWKNLEGCEHSFCVHCLGDYLSDCARCKSFGLSVSCPHHDCDVPMTTSEVKELCPSNDIYSALERASNDMFVASATDVKFCPHPGCSGVVQRMVPDFVRSTGMDTEFLRYTGAVCTAVGDGSTPNPSSDFAITYEGVYDPNYIDSRSPFQPKKAHRFCFACGEYEYHWPVTCERLAKWKEKIEQEVGEAQGHDGETEAGKFEDVAQRLWMKANTRPCPKCKAPIEKNEGCNHMTCTNLHCKHEFCWICRKDWKLHNTATGGFFRCNRWQDEEDHEFYDKPPPDKANPAGLANGDDAAGGPSNANTTEEGQQNGYGTAIHSAHVAFKKSKEMARFLHHFRRYNAHSDSAELERKMADSACVRLLPVVDAAVEFNGAVGFNFGGQGLSFLHAAFTELLECRSILKHSYVFSYFRYPRYYSMRDYMLMRHRRREKTAFEQLQSELEMLTEHMSDIVARAHLRATQMQITFLTSEAAGKRLEFSRLMLSILNDEKKEDMEKKAEAVKADNGGSGCGSRMRHTHTLPSPFDILGSRIAGDDESPLPRMRLENSDNDTIQQTLRASLQQFLLLENSENLHFHESDSDFESGPAWGWTCSACTYMNTGGNHCAVCGNQRS